MTITITTISISNIITTIINPLKSVGEAENRLWC